MTQVAVCFGAENLGCLVRDFFICGGLLRAQVADVFFRIRVCGKVFAHAVGRFGLLLAAMRLFKLLQHVG